MIDKGTSVESLINNTTITYNDRHGDGREDADIEVDWEGVDDKNQISDEHRQQIEDVLKESFDKKADSDRYDIDPVGLSDMIADTQSIVWNDMRNRDKFRWALDNDKVPTREPEEGEIDTDSRVRELIDDYDPKAIWEIADSKYGKDLLLKSDWYGTLDLHDPDTMTRFNAYVGKRKK